MPTLHIHSNIPPEESSFVEFTAKVTEMLSGILNKNASFIQVVYTRSMMEFGNQPGPSALVELTSVDLQQKQINELVEPLSKLLERNLGFLPPTTYIQFHTLGRKHCVWNGRMLPERK